MVESGSKIVSKIKETYHSAATFTSGYETDWNTNSFGVYPMWFSEDCSWNKPPIVLISVTVPYINFFVFLHFAFYSSIPIYWKGQESIMINP